MAANNIGKWSAQATLDARGFATGVETVVRETKRAEKSISSFMGASVGGPFGMRLGFSNLAEAIGINSLQGALAKLGETLDKELELGFLNDQLGTSIEWLTTLRTVAGENSVNADQFAGAMQRVNQVMGQARLGNNEALETFQRLGLSMEQIERQDFQTTFMQIARSLAAMPDRAVRARTAMELFGRGGAGSMLRFVRDLDNSIASVQARGGFTTEADLARFQEMDDAIDSMTTAWENTWRNFLSTVAPAVTRVLQEWGAMINSSWWSRLAALGMPQLGIGAAGLGGATVASVMQNQGNSFQPVWDEQQQRWIIPGAQGGSGHAGGFTGPLGGVGGTGFMLGMATFGAALQVATEAARELANAQIAAARQNEMAMERVRNFSREARSPLENFSERIRQITTAGLDQTQQARLAARAFADVRSMIADTPGIGSLDQGSAEVAQILANVNNPIQDVAATLRALMEQQRNDDAEARRILEQIREALEEPGNQLPQL